MTNETNVVQLPIITTKAYSEDREYFQINDVELDVLPSDIMAFSDNAVYEETFIRSKAVFAFRSNKSRGKIIITLPINMSPLAEKDPKEHSSQVNGLKVLHQLNNYPFCFIKSSRIRSYISARARISTTDFMIFAVDEINVVQDQRVPDVLFAEFHLVYVDFTSQTDNWAFLDWDGEGVDAKPTSTDYPEESKVFTSAFNFDFDSNYQQLTKLIEKYGNMENSAYFDNGNSYDFITLLAPKITDTSEKTEEEKQALIAEGNYKEVKVLTKDGSGSLTKQFLQEWQEGKEVRKKDGEPDPSDDIQTLYITWNSFHSLSFNGVSALKSVKISIKNKLAQQFVASKKYPFVQYMGRYPTRMDIALDFRTDDVYQGEHEESSILSALGQIGNVLDYNNEIYPSASAYNTLKVKSVLTTILGLESIIPNQQYITASSNNQGIETVNISFIETDVEEFMKIGDRIEGRMAGNSVDEAIKYTGALLKVYTLLNNGSDLKSTIEGMDETRKGLFSDVTRCMNTVLRMGLREFTKGIDPDKFLESISKSENTEANTVFSTNTAINKAKEVTTSMDDRYVWPLVYDPNWKENLGTIFGRTAQGAVVGAGVGATGGAVVGGVVGTTVGPGIGTGAGVVAGTALGTGAGGTVGAAAGGVFGIGEVFYEELNEASGSAEYSSAHTQAVVELLTERLRILKVKKDYDSKKELAIKENRSLRDDEIDTDYLTSTFVQNGVVTGALTRAFFDLESMKDQSAPIKTIMDQIEIEYMDYDETIANKVIRYSGTNIKDINMPALREPHNNPFYYLVFQPYYNEEKLSKLWKELDKEVFTGINQTIRKQILEGRSSFAYNSSWIGIFAKESEVADLADDANDTDNTEGLLSVKVDSEYYILNDATQQREWGQSGSDGVTQGAYGEAVGSIDPNIIKNNDATTKKNMLLVYDSFIKVGFTDSQAQALTAEVGRENAYKAKIMVGQHDDPAVGTNIGIISFQGDRFTAIVNHMKGKNLVRGSGNKMTFAAANETEFQATVLAQAEYIWKEIQKPEYKDKMKVFFKNPNASPESMAYDVGRIYIGYAFGQKTLKDGYGGRKEWKTKSGEWGYIVADRTRLSNLKKLQMYLSQRGKGATDIIQLINNAIRVISGEYLKSNDINPKDLTTAKVLRGVDYPMDGDTIYISGEFNIKGGGLRKYNVLEVRVHFIDTPEDSHPYGRELDEMGILLNKEKANIQYFSLAQPGGKECTKYLSDFLKKCGDRIKVPVKMDTDIYGRTLALLFTESGESIQEKMAKDGYGDVWRYQQGGGEVPELLRGFVQQAIKEKKGIWKNTSITSAAITNYKTLNRQLHDDFKKTNNLEEAKAVANSIKYKTIIDPRGFKYNGTLYPLNTNKTDEEKEKNTDETKADGLKNISKHNDLAKQYGGNRNTFAPIKGNESAPISSEMGWRKSRNAIHHGIDFGGGGKTNWGIIAAASGIAYSKTNMRGYGRTVWIDHLNGFCTMYAHLDTIAITDGQHVQYGTILGIMGRSGGDFPIHLHYELFLNASGTVDPFNLNLYRLHPRYTTQLSKLDEIAKKLDEEYGAGGEGTLTNEKANPGGNTKLGGIILKGGAGKMAIRRNIGSYVDWEGMQAAHVHGKKQGDEMYYPFIGAREMKFNSTSEGGGMQYQQTMGLYDTANQDSGVYGGNFKVPMPEYEMAPREVPTDRSVFHEESAVNKHIRNMVYNTQQSLNLAFPVIKVYLVVGNEVEEPYLGSEVKLNYYFELEGIKNVAIVCNNDDNPVDLLTMQIANPSFIRTDIAAVAGKFIGRDLTKVNTYDEVSFVGNRIKIQPGTMLHVRMGAGNNPDDLRTVFNGVVTDLGNEKGICLDVIAEGYGRELLLDYISPGKPDAVGATTPYIFSKAMCEPESIFHFGNRVRMIKAMLDWVPGVDIVGHDVSDPETKRLTTRYLNAFVYEPGNWRQRCLTNIYAAEIERVHSQYSGTFTQQLKTLFGIGDNSAINQNWGTYSYIFMGQTPWSAMKEMEYRHPGTLVKPLFYQDRMTMFFGIKEQMYIARDLNPAFMSRCGAKSNNDVVLNSIKEYMPVRNIRFDIVTGFHIATTSSNILTNNISVNNKFKSGVKVNYYGTADDMIKNGGQDTNIFEMKADDGLAAWDHRFGALQMPGIHEKYSAFMYGTTYLKKEAEKMYSGSLTLIGNACIKAGDYLYLSDDLRRMEGLVKIRECRHFFNEQVGHVTEIVPGLYVEPRNFIYSVLFLKLAFLSRIAVASSNLASQIAGNDAKDFNTYKDYLDQLELYIHTDQKHKWLFNMITGNSKSNFTYEAGYLPVLWASLTALGVISIGRMIFGKLPMSKAASFLGRWYEFRSVGGAVKSLKDVAKSGTTLRAFQAAGGFGRQALTWKLHRTAWYGARAAFSVTRGAVWYAASRSLIAVTRVLSGMLMSNPIGWLVRIAISVVFTFIDAKMQDSNLTRQPIMLFPLAYNGKPYVSGLNGYEYDSYWESTMKRFRKNTMELSKAAFLSNVISPSTLMSSLRTWAAGEYEEELLEKINKDFARTSDAAKEKAKQEEEKAKNSEEIKE